MISLVSTRFNESTWEENMRYREKNGYSCIYGSSVEFCPKIYLNSTVFVIEMNNSKNRVEGVGIVKNRPYMDKYYRIYSICDYNRYIYIGYSYLSRELLETQNAELIQVLDTILFKGKDHLKRGYGFTRLTEKIMKKNPIQELDIGKTLERCFLAQEKEKKEKREKREKREIKE